MDYCFTDVAPRPTVNEKLGHCRILELIASGGSSDVYKVFHEQLEVIRAIKILKPGYSAECKNRLEMEAKISANLCHPNILDVYGFSFWREIPYIEMEFVDGISLNELLARNGTLPAHLALSITHYVCEALNYAGNQKISLYGKHYEGVIHRDIKPANILIASNGTVKLADFGIARPNEVSIHTTRSKLIGTFAYLSPEQFSKDKLDSRCDIYSLGCVLYELIAGKKAYPQRVLNELIGMKIRGVYDEINAPKPIIRIVKKMMDVNREKRYKNASELDKDVLTVLKDITAETPDTIIKSSTQEHTIDFPIAPPRKSPMVLLLPLSFLLLGALLLSVYLFFSRQPGSATKEVTIAETQTPDKQEAQEENETKQRKPEVAETKTETVPQTAVQRTPSQRQPTPTDAASEEQDETNEQYLTYLRQGIAHYNSRNFLRAIPNLENGYEIKGSESADSLIVFLVHSYIEQGLIAKAEKLLEKHSVNDPFWLMLEALSRNARGRYSEAERVLTRINNTTSRFSNTLSFEVPYHLASVRKNMYQENPSSENLQIAIQSWQSFLRQCNESGGACDQTAYQLDMSAF
ncbi:protein kinase [Chitinispirillales bacterium ANBcel5]|uniref:serine/threonine-protein kinase n=1 Tax=Cellulosispirillum alkaliphilum TaxID=3039283 RepID=UPI002A4E64FE|nr:protein kinase [Chitinispirillales bacterium ANBcel5]